MDVKAYESRKHILNMLERRGYNVDMHRNYSLTEIKMMYSNNELDFMVKKQDESKKCYIKYHICKKCRCNDLKKIILNIYGDVLDEHDELIVICKENIRITNAKDNFKVILNHFWNKHKYYVSLFQIEALMIDITEHDLVPKHVIIEEDEISRLLKKHNITIDNLPSISRFDPVAKVIGLKPGNVCKIIRTSFTTGETLYYRLCK